ncbi:hypothetical protein, partial [Pantoea agglomerans]|uniref:hypothetical protein n=1 Tax=Enterobacter agglomerans TaxID=549 RepID=UPI003C7B7ADB
ASQIVEELFDAIEKVFECGLFFSPAAPPKLYSGSRSSDLCFSLIADPGLSSVRFVPEADISSN